MILEIIFQLLFPKKVYYKKNFKNLSSKDRVKQLEKRRQIKGYRKEWLYYRCKEEDLLKEYNSLYKSNTSKIKNKKFKNDSRIKFSFGKYRGKPIKEVWENDNHYARWVLNQEWLDDYPEIQYELENLHHKLG